MRHPKSKELSINNDWLKIKNIEDFRYSFSDLDEGGLSGCVCIQNTLNTFKLLAKIIILIKIDNRRTDN